MRFREKLENTDVVDIIMLIAVITLFICSLMMAFGCTMMLIQLFMGE